MEACSFALKMSMACIIPTTLCFNVIAWSRETGRDNPTSAEGIWGVFLYAVSVPILTPYLCHTFDALPPKSALLKRLTDVV